MSRYLPSIPDRLITGIPRMDNEHQSLVELIAWIEDICIVDNATDCLGCVLTQRDKCGDRLDALLNRLSVYVRDHFRYEDRLMDWLVPKDHANVHKAAHRAIENRLGELSKEFVRDRNTAAASRRIVEELRGWLHDHIEQLDLDLATYIGPEDTDEAATK